MSGLIIAIRSARSSSLTAAGSAVPATLTSVFSCSTSSRAGPTPMSALMSVSSISSQACSSSLPDEMQVEQHRADRRVRPGQPAAQPGQPPSRRRRLLDDGARALRRGRRGRRVRRGLRRPAAPGSGGASVPAAAWPPASCSRSSVRGAARVAAAGRQRPAARAQVRNEACGAAADDDNGDGSDDQIFNHGATSLTDSRRCAQLRTAALRPCGSALDGLALPQPLADHAWTRRRRAC